jgi:hypothetical protein
LIHGWKDEQKVLYGNGCTDSEHYFFYSLVFIENEMIFSFKPLFFPTEDVALLVYQKHLDFNR